MIYPMGAATITSELRSPLPIRPWPSACFHVFDHDFLGGASREGYNTERHRGRPPRHSRRSLPYGFPQVEMGHLDDNASMEGSSTLVPHHCWI